MCIRDRANMAMRWYVVQAYSGFEQHVKRSLLERITREGLKDRFGQVLVPTEEVVEMRDGQKRKSDRKFFPGYVLVQMEMDNDTWHLVRNVPKVLGFIGGTSDKPAPISEKEAQTLSLIHIFLAINQRPEKLAPKNGKGYLATPKLGF